MRITIAIGVSSRVRGWTCVSVTAGMGLGGMRRLFRRHFPGSIFYPANTIVNRGILKNNNNNDSFVC